MEKGCMSISVYDGIIRATQGPEWIKAADAKETGSHLSVNIWRRALSCSAGLCLLWEQRTRGSFGHPLPFSLIPCGSSSNVLGLWVWSRWGSEGGREIYFKPNWSLIQTNISFLLAFPGAISEFPSQEKSSSSSLRAAIQEQIKLSAYPTDPIETTTKSRKEIQSSRAPLNWESCKTKLSWLQDQTLH